MESTKQSDQTSRASRKLRWYRRSLLPRLGVLCIVGAALVQELSPIYRFPDPRPFSGEKFYNPYDGFAGQWLTSNFHAHAHAWAGLTTGKQSPDAVRRQYRAMGYSIISVSDYQHVTLGPSGDPSFIPVYEHGYNLPKTHQLAIGAHRVVWGDFIFWQSRHQKQRVLNELKSSAELVAIAHPELRAGYSFQDFQYLTNYDLLEIVSHFGIAVKDWDAALSAGHPVWAIGSDDSHDASDPDQTGSTWTMIGSESRDSSSVVRSLRGGRAYVVRGRYGRSDVTVKSLDLRGDTIVLQCSAPVERIDFFGQNGRPLASIGPSTEGRYVIQPNDRYVRSVITTSQTKMYLNPVLRYSGAQLPHPVATIDSGRTWFVRLSILCALAMTALLTVGAPPIGAQTQLRGAIETPLPSELPFGVGEKLEYQVKFGVLPVGSGSMNIESLDTLRDRRLMHIVFTVSGGTLFFKVHDVMESWFDAESLSSARFTQNLNEGPRHYQRRFDFYPDTRTVIEEGKPAAPSVEFPLDDASFVYFVRTQPLVVGESYAYERYFRPDANPVVIRVLRKERITVPAGTFDGIVVQPVIKTRGIFSEGGHAEIWLSDDDRRMVLQLKSSLPFGSINLYLRRFEAGERNGLRAPTPELRQRPKFADARKALTPEKR